MWQLNTLAHGDMVSHWARVQLSSVPGPPLQLAFCHIVPWTGPELPAGRRNLLDKLEWGPWRGGGRSLDPVPLRQIGSLYCIVYIECVIFNVKTGSIKKH